MPGGIANPVVGYAPFTAIKFAGYSLAAGMMSHVYERPDRNPLVVGATRTLIGMAAGAAYFGIMLFAMPLTNVPGLVLFPAGLFPVRILEWWLLIWLFYDRRFETKKLDWKVVLAGTFWSYLCDVPAMAGLIATG